MLQPSVLSPLARLNSCLSNIGSIRFMMDVKYQGPLKKTVDEVSNIMRQMSPNAKHWFIGGSRSIAVAIKCLQEEKVIAIPTDTIYGLAVLSNKTTCIDKLYDIKGRDKSKPFAICLSTVNEIPRYGVADHVSKSLLLALLPGPVTIILKRQPTVNPDLNPGTDTIGIRVTDSKFIRSICKLINQPLALTSANLSNEPSSLTAEEFSHLWPRLGAIFYTIPRKSALAESNRVGSTIIDLTVPYEYKVIRHGIHAERVCSVLHRYGLSKHKPLDE